MSSVNNGPSVSQQANTQAVMESPNTDTFGLADPTGTIGLTAVAGTANTAPRSDSAPALSQAITPTWTGQHIFSSTASSGAVQLASAVPALVLNETDGAADNRVWRFRVENEQFQCRLSNDAISGSANWLTVDRTLNVADLLTLGASKITFGNTGLATEYLSLGAAPTTGAQTATFSATNKPGAGAAGPTAWLPVTVGATTYYIPLFGTG